MKKLWILGLTAVLSACGVSSTDGVISRDKNSGGFMGLTENSTIEVDGESALKGVSNVVVGSFKVGFVDSASNSRKAGGGLLSSGFGGKASGKVKLEGVSDATKQAITEAAYKDFLGQLRTSGFKIAARSGFVASSSYSGATKYDFPYEADDSGFLSAYGVSRFYQPKSFGSKGIMFMNDIPDVSGGFAFSNGQTAAAEYALANKVAVISATYLVDFAAAGGHGGSWSMSASVEVGQNLAVTTGSVKFAVDQTSTFTSGMANVSIGQPIESNEEFGEIIDDTSDANVAVQETLNVITALAGHGTNRSREYVIKADPKKYSAITRSLLKKANQMALDKAASLK